MRSIQFVLAGALALLPLAAHADERPGDAALGAVSGALVFGPVGLVAGAIVGYAAGPSISQSWRRNRNHPRRAVGPKQPTRVAARPRTPVPTPRPQVGSVAPQTPAPGAGGPPVQGLE
jgi:hypothetical protein